MTLHFRESIEELVRARTSWRAYEPWILTSGDLAELEKSLASLPPPPFGSALRHVVVPARSDDGTTLRGLHTYGFISNAAGFVVGVLGEDAYGLEDFGYVTECFVLHCTDRGLGTCWLGGTFDRSSFSRRADVHDHEQIPAVVAFGKPTALRGMRDRLIRLGAGSHKRKPLEELVCCSGKGGTGALSTLSPELQTALEAGRLAPSASNKQPWRFLVDGPEVHLYLHRDERYRGLGKTLGLVDLQRLDLGIVMAHLDLVLTARGHTCTWVVEADPPSFPGEPAEYRCTLIY